MQRNRAVRDRANTAITVWEFLKGFALLKSTASPGGGSATVVRIRLSWSRPERAILTQRGSRERREENRTFEKPSLGIDVDYRQQDIVVLTQSHKCNHSFGDSCIQ